jgi:hypothetical protein
MDEGAEVAQLGSLLAKNIPAHVPSGRSAVRGGSRALAGHCGDHGVVSLTHRVVQHNSKICIRVPVGGSFAPNVASRYAERAGAHFHGAHCKRFAETGQPVV